MFQRVQLDILRGAPGMRGALVRYDIMERINRSCSRLGIGLVAFGFGDSELRLVVEASQREIGNLIRGLKVGTRRALCKWNVDVIWSKAEVEPVATRLEHAVAWAHRAPVDSGASGPLASPWSSHRDLLGFRRARFFDASVLRGVDARQVHELAGGRPLPTGWPPREGERESLALLLRLAAAVLGVLPADRRCFRLFVHLARARGWGTVDLAGALVLTRRRVRQLAAMAEPLLPVVMTALSDPRLCRVP
jgi:hypothetical protein